MVSLSKVLALLLCGLGSGCPRDIQIPDAPNGQPCNEDIDCAPDGGAACGEIRSCIAGQCEISPSRSVPCLDSP